MGLGSDYKLIDKRAQPDPELEDGALKEGVYWTIGAAIKDGGGTIVLLPDVYEETLLLESGEKIMSLAAAKELLEGEAGEDLPTQSGDGTAIILGVSFHTITLLGDAELTGITIQQRGPGNWFAVVCASGSPTLAKCDIDGATSSCVGITAEGAEPTLVECKIHGSFTGAGVCAFGGARGTLDTCKIYSNKFSGIEVSGENTELTIKLCEIHANRRDGVLVYEGAKATLEGNTLARNYHCGLEVRDKAIVSATANTMESNDFGVVVARTGICNLTENTISRNFITGVEISKAPQSEDGEDELPPPSEITGNKISCNLESGLKIWYQGAAKLDKNTIEANLEPIALTPRSRRHIDMGEREEVSLSCLSLLSLSALSRSALSLLSLSFLSLALPSLSLSPPPPPTPRYLVFAIL